MKKALSLMIIFILLLSACGCGNSEISETTSVSQETAVEDVFVADGVYIRSIDGYSGKFAEDGSDKAVENTVQITVENVSAKDIQLLYVSATDSLGRALRFEITTLPAGSKLTCCEINCAEYSDGLYFTNAEASQLAYFQNELSLYPETLLLMCADNTIEVKNISENDYAGGRIHYKTVQDDVFTAGITYSLSIPAIPKGESKVLSSKHFIDGSSRIVFITNE